MLKTKRFLRVMRDWKITAACRVKAVRIARSKTCSAVGAVAIISLACATVAPPANAAVTFKGKDIDMMIASSAGGGTDLMGRLFARFLPKYLPGSPRIVARDMGSRGRKILAGNEFEHAKPDGLSVMQTDSSMLSPVVLSRHGVTYKPEEFRPVGAINRGGSVVMIRKDALPRLKNPSARPVIVAAASGQRTWQAMLVWGKRFLGWNVKWTKGYKGSDAMSLAVRRGEADAFATAGANVIDTLLRGGSIDLLVQQGVPQGGSIVARDDFKNVPIMDDLLKKANVPEVAFRAYKSVVGPSDIDKWLTLPPRTPDAIVTVYRTAFDKAVKDPEFLAAAHKISREIKVIDGADVARMIRELRSVPPKITKYGEDLREKYNLLPKK